MTVICTPAFAEAPCVSVAEKVTVNTRPACELVGVKLNTPFAGLKDEFAGRAIADSVTASPSGSLAVTVKVRSLPTAMICGPGTLITGGRLPDPPEVTVICSDPETVAP